MTAMTATTTKMRARCSAAERELVAIATGVDSSV